MSLRRGDGSLDPDVVLAAYEERRAARGPVVNMMHELLRTYNGEIALPLPELNASEHSLVANLVVQGVDAMGQRISSIIPDIKTGSLKETKSELQRAADRRSVMLTWWDKNAMPSKLARRARHYVGHGATSTIIRPNSEWDAPQWHLRRPFETFAAETTNDDDIVPGDVIYCYERKYGWLRSNYPAVAADFHIPDVTRANSAVEIIEYVDCHGMMLIARNQAEYTAYGTGSSRKVRILENVMYDYNDVAPYTVVGRPTLGGKTMGMFDQNVPMFRMQAKLAALEVDAIRDGIYPKVWFVGDGRSEPTIVSWPDPMRGKPGIMTNGTMQVVQPQPTYLAPGMGDRLEYAQRQTARIPAEQGGMSSSNVRTGKRGDAILSQTVDFPVQEAQDDLCRALEHENRAAVAIQKYHFGRKSISFFIGGDAMKAEKQYVPKDLFDTDKHRVKYPYSGADINTLSINVMQLAGSELISKELGREMHPLIADPEQEHDRIILEGLEKAVLAGIQTRVASPDPAQALPIGDVVRLMTLVKSNKVELPEAWEKVQQEAQERQAQQAEAMAPETMPGAEVAGAGAEQATIPEAPQGTQNLASLFNAMRQPRAPRQAVAG